MKHLAEQLRDLISEENFGVFTWEKQGMYRTKDAIKIFKSEKRAQNWADKQNDKDPSQNLVVRTLSEDSLSEAKRVDRELENAFKQAVKKSIPVILGKKKDWKLASDEKVKIDADFGTDKHELDGAWGVIPLETKEPGKATYFLLIVNGVLGDPSREFGLETRQEGDPDDWDRNSRAPFDKLGINRKELLGLLKNPASMWKWVK